MTPGGAPARAWAGHPLWLVGFRPFFPLACLAAAVLPLAWVALWTGALRPPPDLAPLQWHAHELFFGFGLAVLGGFLLTATKNWVKVRGHHGRTLQGLAAAWLLERAAMWWGGAWPSWVRWPVLFLYPVALTVLLTWTLVRGRRDDSYRDNPLFLVALPALVLAKALLLSPAHFAQGRDVTLALFRLAFLVMLERTLTQFLKAAFQVTLRRVAWVDAGLKALALVLVAAPWLPGGLRAGVDLALAALVVGRFAAWRPDLAFRRLDLAVMYVGGLALAAQLVLDAVGGAWVGALPVHVFTFGTMGLIIPAMFVRITKGHTGRPVTFDALDRAVLWVMGLAFLARVVAPQLWPAQYQAWLWTAAGAWALGFSVTGVRLLPRVLAERVDGKEH